MLNFRIIDRINPDEYHYMLLQSNVISWRENYLPKLTLDLYTDINHRKHSNKILLTVNKYKQFEKEWKMLLKEEFLRIPKMLGTREKEIMHEMLHDQSAGAIAESKGISIYTVKSHWRNILTKTNCASREHLKFHALDQGWL
jgi:DNA-binding CsgD family transcriptional regulator